MSDSGGRAGLVSPEIAAIAPYQPGKPLEELERELGARWPKEGAIKLASNENLLGPSPLALAAASGALAGSHLYPDGAAYALRERIAERLNVSRSQILHGAGSNELIDLVVHTFCGPDQEVLAPAVSFACYRLAALGHRRAFRESPNGPKFAVDVGALLDAVSPRTKVVFLANPNNPTGVHVGRADFAELVRRLPQEIVLAVDEAYFEYARAADYPNALEFAAERERLIVLRTFSKVYGLAALRVGYAVAPSELIEHLDRLRLTFNVSTVGQVAARAALDDAGHVTRSRQSNAVEIEGVARGLSALGLEVVPSQANFVLVGLGAREGRAVYQRLLERGVIVRPMDGYGLPRHLRITVGTAAQNQRLLDALAESL